MGSAGGDSRLVAVGRTCDAAGDFYREDQEDQKIRKG
jgi:hypothetical protein